MDIQNLENEINLLHERICCALGDSTRILILYLLSENELYVNQIAEEMDAPQSTVSRHLRVLRDSNLVTAQRHGTSVRYRVADHRIIDVLDQMRKILNDQIQANAALTSTTD